MMVVWDLDGTIAWGEDRARRHLYEADGTRKASIDWSAYNAECEQDQPIPHALETLHALYDAGHDVRIWTARSEECRSQTVNWLTMHGVPPDVVSTMLMRPIGDHRDDNELKPLWMAEHGRPDLVFEDRNRVVAAWRAHGVPCYQVALAAF